MLLTINSITQYVTNSSNRENFNSSINIISNLVSLIIPLFSSFIISITQSYTTIFIISLIFYILCLVLIVRIKIVIPVTIFNFKNTLQNIFKHKDTKNSIKANFSNGIFSGINMVILPILILSLLNNISGWGVFNTILAVISIIGSFIYSKLFKKEKSKYPLLFFSFVFVSVGFIIGANYSVPLFFFYIVLNTVMSVIISVGYSSIMQNIIDEYSDVRDSVVEYNIVQETILSFGRILILSIALFLPSIKFDQSNSILIFLVLTIVPFFISISLADSNILTK